MDFEKIFLLVPFCCRVGQLSGFKTWEHLADHVAITWPEQDEQGNTYVSIQLPGDVTMLISTEPTPEKHQAEIRAYLKTNASRESLMTETEEEKAADRWKAAHADMVYLFMKWTSIEHVQSTFDLLKPETQDHIRCYEA